MAISLMQTKGGGTSSGTSMSATWDSNTTSGNLILVFIALGSTTISTVSDSQKNVYSAAYNTTFGLGRFALFYAPFISGGTTPTVTVTFGGTVQGNVIIREYSGLVNSGPLDVKTTNTGVGGTLSSGATATTAYAVELVVGGCVNGGTPTAGAGFGNLATQQTAGTTIPCGAEDLQTSVTGSQTATFGAGSGNWGCGVATFHTTKTSRPNPILRPAIFKPGYARFKGF